MGRSLPGIPIVASISFLHMFLTLFGVQRGFLCTLQREELLFCLHLRTRIFLVPLPQFVSLLLHAILSKYYTKKLFYNLFDTLPLGGDTISLAMYLRFPPLPPGDGGKFSHFREEYLLRYSVLHLSLGKLVKNATI